MRNAGREPWTQLKELGSPVKSGRLLTRPSQTAHFCGLRFKTKGNTLRFSPARGASPPHPQSGFQMPPPRGGTPAPLSCRPPLSLSGELSICPAARSTLQVRLTECGRGAGRQPPARVCSRPRRPRAGRPGMLRRGSGSAGCFPFFKQNALAAGPSLLSGQPPSLHTHAAPPGTRAARCRSRQTMGSWPAG